MNSFTTSLHVQADQSQEVSRMKKVLYSWLDDARVLGCNLQIDLELVEFPEQQCNHLWCAGHDRSNAYDLIQLCRGINSQALSGNMGTMNVHLTLDGHGFNQVQCSKNVDVYNYDHYL